MSDGGSPEAAAAARQRPGPALLEVRELVKTFRRGARTVEAIDRFSLTVSDGEFVAIVGPSGCGKSTFLHILGGFEPHDSGTMLLNGAPVMGPGPDRGMLFQEFALYPWRSVIGNVGWALEVQGKPRAERMAAAEHYLKLVGLSGFRDAYPAELSGGMKQRVALARVLAFEPRMLLMDEPFGALDAQTRELMQEELNAIWQQTRNTVLFVTHDIDEAIYLADRVIVFTARPGRIKDEVRIELERPRRIDVKKSAAYMGYRNRVWDSLRAEVLKAREEFR
jgi:NitT/TauT family transport system ATP-binding protein